MKYFAILLAGLMAHGFVLADDMKDNELLVEAGGGAAVSVGDAAPRITGTGEGSLYIKPFERSSLIMGMEGQASPARFVGAAGIGAKLQFAKLGEAKIQAQLGGTVLRRGDEDLFVSGGLGASWKLPLADKNIWELALAAQAVVLIDAPGTSSNSNTIAMEGMSTQSSTETSRFGVYGMAKAAIHYRPGGGPVSIGPFAQVEGTVLNKEVTEKTTVTTGSVGTSETRTISNDQNRLSASTGLEAIVNF